MLHARSDYAHIQDPTGKIPADEPVFLLRARDVAAPFTVLFWAELVRKAGASADLVEAAAGQAMRMMQWQKVHGTKVPDGPKPPAPDTPDLGPLSDEEALIVRQIREHKASGGGPSAILLD